MSKADSGPKHQAKSFLHSGPLPGGPAPDTEVCRQLVAQMVKNLPAVWEIRVRSLDWEDALEEGMSTHSNILAWKIPWTEEPGGLQPIGLQRVRHD